MGKIAIEGTARTESGPLRLLRRDDVVAVAEIGAICIVIWRGSVTTTPFELQRSGLAEVVQRHPEGAGFLCIVEKTAKPPSESLRRASSKMVLSHGDHLKCIAIVIEAQGFVASVQRGAFAAMLLLARHRKAPFSVFANVREAAQWMAGHIEMPPAVEFAAAVNSTRATFPASPL